MFGTPFPIAFHKLDKRLATNIYVALMLVPEFFYDISHTSIFTIHSTEEAHDSTVVSIKKEFENTPARY
jgi:hypothetical protein